MDELHEALHEAYDVDVAKLNRLAARSAERAEKLKAENSKLRELVIGIWPFAKKTYQSTRRIRDGKVVVFDACEIMRELGIEV